MSGPSAGFRALGADRDKMLQMGNKFREEKRDETHAARLLLMTVMLLAAAVGSYCLMMHAWFHVLHYSSMRFGIIVLFLLGLGCGCTGGSYKRVMGKDSLTMRVVGVLVLQATLLALVFGFHLYVQHLVFYFKYQEMRTYTNVAAAQQSGGFRDGSMFLFTEDSHLDSMRGVGYQSRWTGNTYCVAPIIDPTMTEANLISFWAVGENCCGKRASFRCDSGEDYFVRTGLALLRADEIVRPWMSWATSGDIYDYYLEAIKLQEAEYVTQANKKPILLRWISNPIALKDSYFQAATTSLWNLSLAYVLVLTAICFVTSRWLMSKRLSRGQV